MHQFTIKNQQNKLNFPRISVIEGRNVDKKRELIRDKVREGIYTDQFDYVDLNWLLFVEKQLKLFACCWWME